MKRIPRPIGTTELGRTNNRELLYEHIINHYINTNFTYCQLPMNIEQLSYYIGIEPTMVNVQMVNKAKLQHQLLTQDGQKELAEGILNLSLSSVLSDRSTALQHLNILLTAQGQTYKPFISSEVTRALNTLIASTQGISNMVKTLSPGQGFNVQINNQVTQNQLTVESALELIDSKGTVPLLEDPNAIQGLAIEYEIDDMPEVVATRQENYDTSKEGISFAASKAGHIDRRADSIGVDLESDEI